MLVALCRSCLSVSHAPANSTGERPRCPKCEKPLRIVELPPLPAPVGQEARCIACSKTLPWSIFDSTTGAAVCVDCGKNLASLPPFDANVSCPMCGAAPAQIATTACPGSMLVEGTICEGNPMAEAEHIHRRCEKCRHEFLQQPIVADVLAKAESTVAAK